MKWFPVTGTARSMFSTAHGLLPIYCHYCFTYNLFSRILRNSSPCFVCLPICRLVACSCKWSSGRCVSSLFVKRCVLISCICSSVFLCLFTIKNSQIGNTGIRHNRKKTLSPLRSVIAGFHCIWLRACDKREH